MSEKIIHLNESAIKHALKELVRNSVEETLNGLLEQEAQALTIHHKQRGHEFPASSCAIANRWSRYRRQIPTKQVCGVA